MQEQILELFQAIFISFNNLENNFSSVSDSGTLANAISSLEIFAIAIKPIGYSLLALFALLEFVHLSERVGNVNGFMGTGLVIEVLIKIILCKLVVDNSTQICTFIVGVGDQITSLVGDTAGQSINFNQFEQNIENAFPDWWDIFGQVAFFAVSCIFSFLTFLSVMIVQIIFVARFIELYVLTAVSPIPLSTCLSKHFNVAPNYIKNVFAVALQGTLLLLVIKIFNVIFANMINGIGVIERNDWGALWSMLGMLLFCSVLLLVCSFQTQRWAKSICHAM